MNKQELIKHFEDLPYVSITQMGKKSFIDMIEQLDEPKRVKVPQFVADYIEYTKKEDYHLLGAMCEVRKHENKEIDHWLYTDDNIETFARAWLDGYTIEEKRYRVEMKGIESNSQYLVFGQLSETWWFGSAEQIGNVKSEHTRKEIEDGGFGWVFDCEGIEVKKVE